MDSGWIAATAGAIGASVAMSLMRRFYPAPPPPKLRRSLAELQEEYGKWELLSIPLFFAIAPAAAYLWWRLLLALTGPGGFFHEGELFSLRPRPIVWAIPSGLLGLISSIAPINAILRHLLRERYAEFVAYGNLRHGFDGDAIEKPMYLGFGGLAAIAVFMLGNWYIVFGLEQIRFNPFLGVSEHVFTYQDVEAIETAPAFVAPNGRVVRRREYVVEFSDGTAWNTNADPSDASKADVAALIEAISERSGVPITELPLLRRDAFR